MDTAEQRMQFRSRLSVTCCALEGRISEAVNPTRIKATRAQGGPTYRMKISFRHWNHRTVRHSLYSWRWVDSCGNTDVMRYKHRAVYPTEMTSPPSLPVMPQSGGVVACPVCFMPSAGWVELKLKLALWRAKPLYRLQTSGFLYLWLRLLFLLWLCLFISM
jgi:hypothetical protein